MEGRRGGCASVAISALYYCALRLARSRSVLPGALEASPPVQSPPSSPLVSYTTPSPSPFLLSTAPGIARDCPPVENAVQVANGRSRNEADTADDSAE